MMTKVILVNQAELYDLPPGWTWTRLADIAEKIADGSHNPPAKQVSGTPMLSAQNILNNRIDFTNVRLVSEEDFEKEAKRVSIGHGDVLLTIVGTIGRSTVAEEMRKFAVQRSVAIIKTKIEPWYLSFYFQSPWMASYFLEQAKGTAQKGIYLKKLKDIPVPLAPLSEQRRIAAKVKALLAESKTAREALGKTTVLLRRFRQSVLAEAFRGELTQSDPKNEPAQELLEKIKQERNKGKKITLTENDEEPTSLPKLPESWVWAKLADISEINPGLSGLSLPDNMEVSFLPMKAVAELAGNIDLSLTTTYGKARKGYTPFVEGDIIIAKITPCMENGKIAIVRNLKNGVGFGSTEFHVIRPICEDISREFLFHYLTQESFIEKAKRHMTGTAGQLRVPAKYMREILLPLPPATEQKRIAAKIDEFFHIANEVEASVKKAEERANLIDRAVLTKAFRGELVPQDPNDEPADVLLERIRVAGTAHLPKG